MPKVAYKKMKFGAGALEMISHANQILATYAQRGITITLRGLYYQFVARDLFPDDRKWRQTGNDKWTKDPAGTKNATPNYKWLGVIMGDARLAGLIDWHYMEDRTRNLQALSHWNDPDEIISSAASSYHRDFWENQEYHVEIFIEKDALIGVIEGICNQWDVPFFACRGYTSLSEMWVAGQRLLSRIRCGQRVRIIHLGDHDPSGVDMSRDVEDRLHLFVQHHLIQDYVKKSPQTPSEKAQQFYSRVETVIREQMAEFYQVERIALNMDQIRDFNPPPAPAKLTDSRAGKYVAEFGYDSWELDALEPTVMVDLIDAAIRQYVDIELFDQTKERQEKERSRLELVSKHWEAVETFVAEAFGEDE